MKITKLKAYELLQWVPSTLECTHEDIMETWIDEDLVEYSIEQTKPSFQKQLLKTVDELKGKEPKEQELRETIRLYISNLDKLNEKGIEYLIKSQKELIEILDSKEK